MAQDYDLLLCTFPFEKEWYARHAPRLQVEFVGNPVVDRVGRLSHRSDLSDSSDRADSLADGERIQVPLVVLLPGSRADELRRHLPVLLSALNIIRAAVPDLRARLVLPSEALIGQARGLGLPPDVSVQMGDLTPAIRQATLALAKTGTITLECAYFGIPTVAIYKTSWSTFQVARRIVNVKYVAMPNLLANEAIIPELIQHEATPENIARAALELLRSKSLRGKMKERLLQVAASLGGPGASARAAQAILRSWGPFFCL
jgi:lipid-A-disaccharide synthase